MSNVIEKVVEVHAGGHTIYQFAIPAADLRALGFVSRLSQKEGGVQRNLDEVRVQRIAEAMQKGKDLWLETFLAQMEPDSAWVYENGVIVYDNHFRLSIDDGQHRFYALDALTDEQLSQIGELNVTATHGLTFTERLRLFTQQEERKHIDRGMLLEGRDIIGNWERPVEKNAYEMIKVLGSHPLSPLKDRIILGEGKGTNSRRYPQHLSTTSLHRNLLAVLGDKSLIHGLPFEEQQDIILRFLNIAATKVWPKQWDDSENYMISWNRGVTVLLRFFMRSKVMRMLLVDGDYADVRLHSVLRLASQFDWSTEKNKYRIEIEMLDSIDSLMSKRYTKREQNRDKQR